jgi:hypothetical protein
MAGRGTREPRGKRGEGLGWVLRMEGGGEFYVYAIKKNGGDLCAIKKSYSQLCVIVLNFFTLCAIPSTIR